MIVVVFALGRPGSGKSTAAHHLAEVAWEKGLSAIRIGDFRVLYQMAQEDTQHRQFRPTTPYDGFDVTDFSVLDIALQKLKELIEGRMSRLSSRDDQLIIIEFARDDYRRALKMFGPKILRSAYFLYVDSTVETCKERIQERTLHPRTPDDHYVSPNILDTYYAEDDGYAIESFLENYYQVPLGNIFMITNHGSPKEFALKIKHVINGILNNIPKEDLVGV